MVELVNVLRFRTMVAPYILEFLFWVALAGNIYGAGWLLAHDHWAWWIALVCGTLIIRLIFELGLLAFRQYACLADIRKALEGQSIDSRGSEQSFPPEHGN